MGSISQEAFQKRLFISTQRHWLCLALSIWDALSRGMRAGRAKILDRAAVERVTLELSSLEIQK